MQFCGGWHVLEQNTAELTPIAADLSLDFGHSQFLHRRILLQPLLLYRAINRLLSPCQPRMAILQISHSPRATGFGPSALCVSLASSSTREARAVDLALRLNVLAVCAVFVFVGAILLGAF